MLHRISGRSFPNYFPILAALVQLVQTSPIWRRPNLGSAIGVLVRGVRTLFALYSKRTVPLVRQSQLICRQTPDTLLDGQFHSTQLTRTRQTTIDFGQERREFKHWFPDLQLLSDVILSSSSFFAEKFKCICKEV